MSVLVRNSERASFTTCRYKWWWGWVDCLKTTEESSPLEFGTYIHLALAEYYQPGRKRGPHPAETFEKLVNKRVAEEGVFNLWSDGTFQSGVDLGIQMMEGYVKRWEDADNEYEVISSEQTFQLPIGKIDGQKIVVVGTFDGIWKYLPHSKKGKRLLRFAEHKTASTIKTDQLNMDEQAGTYWTYGPRWLRLQNLLRPGDTFDGILYNFMRKAVPDEDHTRNAQGLKLNLPKKDALLEEYHRLDRPLPSKSPKVDEMIADLGPAALQLGEISKVQDAPYFLRQLTFRGQAEAEAVKVRTFQQIREMLDVKADPDRLLYKNPGPQFMPNCRFCGFRDMCELHEVGQNWEAARDALYKHWEPYADHELPERF